jgi:hypothetical protein
MLYAVDDHPVDGKYANVVPAKLRAAAFAFYQLSHEIDTSGNYSFPVFVGNA